MPKTISSPEKNAKKELQKLLKNWFDTINKNNVYGCPKKLVTLVKTVKRHKKTFKLTANKLGLGQYREQINTAYKEHYSNAA